MLTGADCSRLCEQDIFLDVYSILGAQLRVPGCRTLLELATYVVEIRVGFVLGFSVGKNVDIRQT